MSKRKDASPKTKTVIWAKSAGRCQYPGCNEPLWEDFLSGKEDGNYGFIAHIVAAQETGPRGDAKLSPKLADDISNLMLLCYRHHHLIDVEDKDIHSVECLQAMKKRHEQRVIHQSSLQEDRSTAVLLYGANIGAQNGLVSFSSAKDAILPDRYPESSMAIEIGMDRIAFEDHEPDYWQFQKTNLERRFALTAKPQLEASKADMISVFALAPQPLLVVLGQLLSDIPTAEIFQRHREPAGWRWQNHPSKFDLEISKEDGISNLVALKIGISAKINSERVREVLGDDVTIWSLSVPNPHNDCLKSRNQLAEFRLIVRRLLNQIKAEHGEGVLINVFPAMPVACAVEFGRVWMPKADLPMLIFDQNRRAGGFIPTIKIEQII